MRQGGEWWAQAEKCVIKHNILAGLVCIIQLHFLGDFMNRLFWVFLFVLATIAGCNSSTGNDDNGNSGNNNNTGNGGKYTVSGSVHLTSANGAGISGVTVVISSVDTTATTLTMTTGSDGAFSFGNIAAGSYIVAVAKSNYTFTPTYVAVAVADKNVAVQTFVGVTVNTSGNAGTSALYPLKTGNTWTFDNVDLISSFEILGKSIDTVTGTMAMGGKTYWAISSKSYDSDGEEDSDDTLYFRVENNILYSYGTDFLTAKNALKSAKPAQAAALGKMLVSADEYPLYKFDVSAGTTWDIYKDSSSYQGNSSTIVSTGKYVGTETVGAYTNCAKFELEYTSESVTTSMKIAGKWSKTIWLASNVGPVKIVEKFYTGDTLAAISLLSTTTRTLKTAQLP